MRTELDESGSQRDGIRREVHKWYSILLILQRGKRSAQSARPAQDTAPVSTHNSCSHRLPHPL